MAITSAARRRPRPGSPRRADRAGRAGSTGASVRSGSSSTAHPEQHAVVVAGSGCQPAWPSRPSARPCHGQISMPVAHAAARERGAHVRAGVGAPRRCPRVAPAPRAADRARGSGAGASLIVADASTAYQPPLGSASGAAERALDPAGLACSQSGARRAAHAPAARGRNAARPAGGDMNRGSRVASMLRASDVHGRRGSPAAAERSGSARARRRSGASSMLAASMPEVAARSISALGTGTTDGRRPARRGSAVATPGPAARERRAANAGQSRRSRKRSSRMRAPRVSG